MRAAHVERAGGEQAVAAGKDELLALTPCLQQRPWPAVFREAVELLCADAATVGVKVSGGLDSLAVLCQVAQLRPSRRIIVFCVNLVDDRGQGCAPGWCRSW